MKISDVLGSTDCKIICGAPGIGKTSLGMLENVIDLTSSPYRWLDYDGSNLEEKKGLYKRENPLFVPDYMEAIKDAIKKYKIVLLPLLTTVFLDEIGLNYALAFQSLCLMDAVKSRLIERGNTDVFIKEAMDGFVELNQMCKNDNHHLKFEIDKDNLFLGDAISMNKGWYI